VFPHHPERKVSVMNTVQIFEIDPADRAFLFHALSQLLDYPDADLMTRIQDPAFIEDLEIVLQQAGGGDDPASLCAVLALDFEDVHDRADVDTLLVEREKEYTHLCFASKPRQVHLFESVYRTGKLMQDCTFDIARLYHEAGLRPKDTFDLLPDHIALELEFMAYLSVEEAQAISSKDMPKAARARELQKKVLTDHLIFFGGRFSSALQQHARSVFYRTVGRILGHVFADGSPCAAVSGTGAGECLKV
jgi:putative dimethyl sulfoxide reductase chaperone